MASGVLGPASADALVQARAFGIGLARLELCVAALGDEHVAVETAVAVGLFVAHAGAGGLAASVDVTVAEAFGAGPDAPAAGATGRLVLARRAGEEATAAVLGVGHGVGTNAAAVLLFAGAVALPARAGRLLGAGVAAPPAVQRIGVEIDAPVAANDVARIEAEAGPRGAVAVDEALVLTRAAVEGIVLSVRARFAARFVPIGAEAAATLA